MDAGACSIGSVIESGDVKHDFFELPHFIMPLYARNITAAQAGDKSELVP